MSKTSQQIAQTAFVWGDTVDQINASSLHRIAGAVEKMAGSYSAIIAERDRYYSNWKYWEEISKRLTRRINSLKGAVTRAKRKAVSQ